MDVLNWFITSSKDSTQMSLFVKSVAAFAVLFGLDSTVVEPFGNEIVNLIVAIGMGVSAVTGMFGLYRKVRLGRWAAPIFTD